jgi:3-oxoacyl-[acyl-carrier protein] reductase
VLINNAGLGTSKKLIEMDDAEWDKVIQVTLYGTMRMCRQMMKGDESTRAGRGDCE